MSRVSGQNPQCAIPQVRAERWGEPRRGGQRRRTADTAGTPKARKNRMTPKYAPRKYQLGQLRPQTCDTRTLPAATPRRPSIPASRFANAGRTLSSTRAQQHPPRPPRTASCRSRRPLGALALAIREMGGASNGPGSGPDASLDRSRDAPPILPGERSPLLLEFGPAPNSAYGPSREFPRTITVIRDTSGC